MLVIPFNTQQLFDEHGVTIRPDTDTPFTSIKLEEIYNYFKEHPSMVKLPKQTKIERLKEQIAELGWEESSNKRSTPGISSEEDLYDSQGSSSLQTPNDSDEQPTTTPPSIPKTITKETKSFSLPSLGDDDLDLSVAETPLFSARKSPELLSVLKNDENIEADSQSIDPEDITIPKIPYSVLKLQDENGADKFIIVYPVKLGKGKFGTTKLAQELILQKNEDGEEKLVAGKIIAIKKSLRLTHESEGFEAIFNNEVENTKLIGDRYIGDSIRQTGEQYRDKQGKSLFYNGKMYVASDVIPGSTMEDFIRSRSINERQKLTALLNLFEYLQTFYSKFIQHNDLHLGNILVSLDPKSSQITAKPIDLAEAIARTERTSTTDSSLGQSVDMRKLGRSILECCTKNTLNLPQLTSIATEMASENNPQSLDESIALVKKTLTSPPQTTITPQITTTLDSINSPKFTETAKLKVLLEWLQEPKQKINNKSDSNTEIEKKITIINTLGDNILANIPTNIPTTNKKLRLAAEKMTKCHNYFDVLELEGLVQKQIRLLDPLPNTRTPDITLRPQPPSTNRLSTSQHPMPKPQPPSTQRPPTSRKPMSRSKKLKPLFTPPPSPPLSPQPRKKR